MFNKTLYENTEELYTKALETMKKKSADYAGNVDSMRNFKISAEIAHVKMSQGVLSRLVDKVTRIGNLIEKDAETGEVSDESIYDTIQDLINYSAILHYAIQAERPKKTDTNIFKPLTDAIVTVKNMII